MKINIFFFFFFLIQFIFGFEQSENRNSTDFRMEIIEKIENSTDFRMEIIEKIENSTDFRMEIIENNSLIDNITESIGNSKEIEIIDGDYKKSALLVDTVVVTIITIATLVPTSIITSEGTVDSIIILEDTVYHIIIIIPIIVPVTLTIRIIPVITVVMDTVDTVDMDTVTMVTVIIIVTIITIIMDMDILLYFSVSFPFFIMNFSIFSCFFIFIFTSVVAVEYGEINYHRIEKRQFNFGQWGRQVGQRGENYGRGWGQQW
uniref:Uncharacterized protein n=1 Tax=Caenorhabditis tropicalis TaxID=1561998 RepID=A0A1I7UM99_9PELO